MSSTGHRSHNYSQGSSRPQTVVDKDSMHRVRAMAQRERRTMPPTFRPLLIVIVTLAIGLLLVGLVMIIIAHWPGISGGEGLKIAGGCLVAGGGVALICAIVFICVKKNMEKEQFERSLANIAHTRSLHASYEFTLNEGEG